MSVRVPPSARCLALGVVVLAAVPAGAQKFYPDDPLRSDNDKLDVPVKPAELELSDMYDRFGHMFHDWGASEIGSEATNVNTLDEVPDSSWFTNRHGAERMSIEALVRGPNSGTGPDPNDTWMVFQSKSQGLTPGFQIYDEKDERYVIKLDPVDVPEIASAAEVIATKIFYALGYNTPENYIVRVHPERFVVEPGTEVEDSFGDKKPLTTWRFERSIRRVPRLDDGRMRVTASKYLAGIPIGPFRYYETRSDDPNDVINHEDRRELRGLRLIAAWLNHDDTRAQNTQDAWVEEDGRHYVRHYMLDFGSTLGSGSVDMQYAPLTFTYTIDLQEMKRNALGLGFRVPEYRRADWPAFPEYRAVGRIESDLFDCASWRNDYPNPAFVRMTARDAFWAAKLIMRFTREELAAIAETGEYSHPDHARYLVDTLVVRQRKCGRLGVNSINPLAEFEVDGREVRFANLSEDFGFSEGTTRYRFTWSTLDNDTGRTEAVGEPSTTSERVLSIPADASAPYIGVEIRSENDAFPHWAVPMRVFFRRTGSSYELVGIERDNPPNHTFPMN